MRALAIFLVSLTLYLAVLPYKTDRLRFIDPNIPMPTGDEPYYLLISHSLLYDGDLDLTNNHDRNRDYERFYPAPLISHQSVTERAGHYSKHSPGLPLLTLPFYWLGDQFWLGQTTAVWPAVAAGVALLAALLAANIYLLALEASGSTGIALAAWAAFALTNPVASYSSLIFPAVPAALCTLYAFRVLRNGAGGWRLALAGLAVAFLPWLHPRLALVSISLVVLYLFRWRLVRRPLRLFAPVIVISTALMAYYDLALYGNLLPNAHDHGALAVAGMGQGFLGLLFDQQWGLLPHAPVYALSFSGLIAPFLGGRLAWRRQEAGAGWGQAGDALAVLLVAAPYVALISAYAVWWGEWCPPARYLTPVLPLLALPLARTLRAGDGRLWGLFGLLLLPSLAVMLAFFTLPELMYNHPTGQSALLLWLGERLGGNWPLALIPSLVRPDPQTVGWTLLGWAAGLTGVVFAGLKWTRPLPLGEEAPSPVEEKVEG